MNRALEEAARVPEFVGSKKWRGFIVGLVCPYTFWCRFWSVGSFA